MGSMFGLTVLLASTLLVQASKLEVCHKHINGVCTNNQNADHYERCTSKQAGFENINKDLQKMIKVDFEDSITYLLMASNFDTDAKNHLGFHKYLMEKSDNMWARGKDLMKYALTRGEKIESLQIAAKGVETNTEIENLAVCMDKLKERSREVEDMYTTAQGTGSKKYEYIDPATLHLMEEISQSYTNEIKETSSTLNTLRRLLTDTDIPSHLALQLFDKHLKA